MVAQIKLTFPGLESARLDDEYEYASVPLYVIDAVFSIGVRYEAARQTVVKFCDAHGWEISAIGLQNVSQDYADKLVVQASNALGDQFPNLSAAVLDNVIWQYQRKILSSRGGQTAPVQPGAPYIGCSS